MTEEFFKAQLARLRTRFGEKSFDNEFSRLAWFEVRDMSDARFAWQVNTWIGSRRPSDAPMLAEFKESKLAEKKARKANTSERAATMMQAPVSKSALEILRPLVGNVASIAEAIEVRRLQILRERETNPDYDPMSDRKWRERQC
jgi:hypothetical protein